MMKYRGSENRNTHNLSFKLKSKRASKTFIRYLRKTTAKVKFFERILRTYRTEILRRGGVSEEKRTLRRITSEWMDFRSETVGSHTRMYVCGNEAWPFLSIPPDDCTSISAGDSLKQNSVVEQALCRLRSGAHAAGCWERDVAQDLYIYIQYI